MSLPSDEAKFRQLFESHHEAIQRYCVRRLDPDRANDAVAEVFLVAWRRLDAVGEAAALPWLYGVARNVVRHFYRSQGRHRALVARAAAIDPPAAPGPATQLIRREEDEELTRALGKLRDSDRELLQLKLWEELSHSEIGRVLGITAHAVDMRYRRALKRLASTLHAAENRRLAAPLRASGGER